jgi:hypothetical protein
MKKPRGTIERLAERKQARGPKGLLARLAAADGVPAPSRVVGETIR